MRGSSFIDIEKMTSIPPKKKLKIEETDAADEAEAVVDDQEEALVALIEHRTKEVEHLRLRITYYMSQLAEAERRLEDSQSKLARLRTRDYRSKTPADNVTLNLKMERRSTSPINLDEDYSQPRSQYRPKLLIPAVNPKPSIASGAQAVTPFHSPSISAAKKKGDLSTSSKQKDVDLQDKGTKKKSEPKEHKELIPLICRCSSPSIIRCHPSCHVNSQHKRKLRSLALNPMNSELFVTSALDGVVNLWRVQANGINASLISATDCLSPKQRRWPEDIVWHPEGNSLFCVHGSDDGDSQVSIINLNTTKGEKRVTFLKEKPHLKGIINSIVFMPWDDLCFVTGGSDHGVIFWNYSDGEGIWKPKALHRNLHSSAVMGVAGMLQKQIVMSAGADKRIIGFDLIAGRADFRHQIENKCMSILPNPCDFNLFMVQTGAPGRQLRLYDIRLRQTQIHEFGWKQESSESQSALINQAWSPDGLYISSGSADPMIHIFDIRYNSHKPSQSLKAHQKRVFKAAWHHSMPLIISISSDLQIGLHKIA